MALVSTAQVSPHARCQMLIPQKSRSGNKELQRGLERERDRLLKRKA